MLSLRILIADDEAPARFALRRALSQPQFEILEAADGESALELLRTKRPELVFLDLNMPGKGGQEVLRELGPAARESEIIVLTANDSVSAAVECIRLGAADFVTKPYEVEQLRAVCRRVAQRCELQQRVEELESQLGTATGCGGLIGISRPMQQLFQQLAKAARTRSDVLIRGGTSSDDGSSAPQRASTL